MRTVLVTGVGGNVGQGILRVLHALDLPLRMVGTDVQPRSGGSHLCETVTVVPYAWEPGYLTGLRAACDAGGVDLVIPATDAETVALAEAPGLPPVVCSPAQAAQAAYDKLETARRFEAAGIPFAPTWLPADSPSLASNVVKPRRGRGSRDLHFDAEPAAFDPDFVVQQRLIGPELTTGLYVRRDGGFHGCVTLERRLSAGTTVSCRADREYDAVMRPIAERAATALGVRGPCNIQAILVQPGVAIPFEVNCRFSGTASIRHQLGFQDVRYAIDEWLLGRTPPDPTPLWGASAERLLMDVIYREGETPFVF